MTEPKAIVQINEQKIIGTQSELDFIKAYSFELNLKIKKSCWTEDKCHHPAEETLVWVRLTGLKFCSEFLTRQRIYDHCVDLLGKFCLKN